MTEFEHDDLEAYLQGVVLSSEQDTSDDLESILVIDQRLLAQTTDAVLNLEHAILQQASQAADEAARQNVFLRRRERKAHNSIRSEIAGLTDFMLYLREAGVPLSIHLADEPRLWSAITYGLVEGFMQWEQQKGYATKTRNNHLSIIKLYAGLAQQAGFQSADQCLAIKTITSVRGAEAKRIDAQRSITRIGNKKAEATILSREQLYELFAQPTTPQGQRDAVALLLLYDMSLRPNEAVALCLRDLNMKEGRMRVYRQKTDLTQYLQLTPRTLHAITGYLRTRKDRSPNAPLLVQTRKDGNLVELITMKEPDGTSVTRTPHWSVRNLRERVHLLGTRIGIPDLTSYDGRHQWTRDGIKGGTDPFTLSKAGGWKGRSHMVELYYGQETVANERVKLDH